MIEFKPPDWAIERKRQREMWMFAPAEEKEPTPVRVVIESSWPAVIFWLGVLALIVALIKL